MGFALWIDSENRTAWVQGTHEYRPMGAAVIAVTDQFRHRDFHQLRRRPAHVQDSFAGFFGSLEEVNEYLRRSPRRKPPYTVPRVVSVRVRTYRERN